MLLSPGRRPAPGCTAASAVSVAQGSRVSSGGKVFGIGKIADEGAEQCRNHGLGERRPRRDGLPQRRKDLTGEVQPYLVVDAQRRQGNGDVLRLRGQLSPHGLCPGHRTAPGRVWTPESVTRTAVLGLGPRQRGGNVAPR